MAKKIAKAGETASPTPDEDKKAHKEAAAALDKKSGKAKTVAEQEIVAQRAENEPEELPSIEEIARRATLAERRTASPANTAPTTFDLTVKVNKEEAAEINKLLAALRLQARIDAGETIKKAYLVNDTGSDRVRWGGRTFFVPQGRNELTPEFVEQYFTDGITAADLEGGLLGSRVKVEYDEPKVKEAKAPKAKARKATASKK